MSSRFSPLAFATLFAAIGLGFYPLAAQAPRIGMEVDTAVMSVGDRITLTVTVDHGAGSQVVWPDSLNLAPFEVLQARADPPATLEDGLRSSLALTLTAFELGDLEVPGFEVGITDTRGETTTVTTDPFGIRVITVGLDDGGDIREIKGPIGIPRNLLPVLLVLLAAALAGIVGRALYRRFRRGDPELRDTMPAAPWREPHEIALEALDRIENSALLENGEIKEYHIRVSEVLRNYVEGRFRVPALEMTTADILADLKERGLDTPVLERFETFFGQCDMVKFAKYLPEPHASRAILTLGRQLVEDTIPVERKGVSEPAGLGSPGLQEVKG